MTQRVPKIPIVQQLLDLRTDVNAIKAAQAIGGDSLLGYLTYSNNLNDYSFGIAVGTNESFTLTFKPTHTAYPAIVDLYLFYSIGQPDTLTYAVPPWSNGAAVAYEIQKLPPTATSSQWYMTFDDEDGTGASYTVYLKFIFSATDTGTWSIASA